MTYRSAIAALIVLSLLFPPAVFSAGESASASLDEEMAFLEAEFTVESASRHVQKTSQAPASVTVITAEDIRRFGCRNIDDVLRSVIGLYVTNDRNYSYLGVRGFGLPSDYNSRVLLLLNGHRMNDPTYGQASLGWESGFDLGDVEKIEIIRGPSSALYGTSALFGIINFVTRKAAGSVSGEADALIGDPGLVRLAGRMRGEKGPLSFQISLQAMDRGGHDNLHYPEFAADDLNGDGIPDYTGYASNSDAESAYGLRFSAALAGFKLTAFRSSREKEIPTASFDTLFDVDKEKTRDARTFVELAYDGAVGETFNWSAKASYDKYAYDGWYPYAYNYDNTLPAYTSPPYTIFRDDHPVSWWSLEVLGDLSAVPANRFIFGGAYSWVTAEMKTYDNDPYTVYQDDEYSFYSINAFMQDEIAIGKYISLALGVNYSSYDTDIYQGKVDRFNPRLAFIAAPWAKTTIKLIYGEAFRVPTISELYYNDGGISQIPNPDLEAEVMKTGELVLEQGMPLGLHLRFSSYRNRIQNLIMAVTDADDIMQFQNSDDDIISQGVELAVRRSLSLGLGGFASVAYQNTEFEDSGDELPNSPHWLACLGISIPLAAETSLAIENQYIGRRRTVDLSDWVKEYLVTNLTLSAASLAPGLEVRFIIHNLFDVDYADPGSFDHRQTEIPQDGRGLACQLTYSF